MMENVAIAIMLNGTRTWPLNDVINTVIYGLSLRAFTLMIFQTTVAGNHRCKTVIIRCLIPQHATSGIHVTHLNLLINFYISSKSINKGGITGNNNNSIYIVLLE